GGSQPPTELEADKFSGFVLYKMGASLDDAQLALGKLVAEGPDGRTHPGRGKRMAAIAEGWKQACEQQGHAECAILPRADASAVASAPPVASAPRVAPGPAASPAAATPGEPFAAGDARPR